MGGEVLALTAGVGMGRPWLLLGRGKDADGGVVGCDC